eukprot:5522316-Prymnesium_polylepis.1
MTNWLRPVCSRPQRVEGVARAPATLLGARAGGGLESTCAILGVPVEGGARPPADGRASHQLLSKILVVLQGTKKVPSSSETR